MMPLRSATSRMSQTLPGRTQGDSFAGFAGSLLLSPQAHKPSQCLHLKDVVQQLKAGVPHIDGSETGMYFCEPRTRKMPLTTPCYSWYRRSME